jgi:hypothetical protein
MLANVNESDDGGQRQKTEDGNTEGGNRSEPEPVFDFLSVRPSFSVFWFSGAPTHAAQCQSLTESNDAISSDQSSLDGDACGNTFKKISV